MINNTEQFEQSGDNGWDIKMAPYRLEFKNISSYMENCMFCNR